LSADQGLGGRRSINCRGGIGAHEPGPRNGLVVNVRDHRFEDSGKRGEL